MKRFVSIFLLLTVSLWLVGCSGHSVGTSDDEYAPVEHVGEPPEHLKEILKNNLFRYAKAFDDRVLLVDTVQADEKERTVDHSVRMLDIYGKELATYSCRTDKAYHLRPLLATDDGGFLIALGFSDYSYGDGRWASDSGYASRIIKFDGAGKEQFHTPLPEVEGSALEFCFEKDGKFYFFGDIQTPETKRQGIHSQTDIYMTVLDQNGTVLHRRSVAGSDFDRLLAAEESDGEFILSISAQSDDGEYVGSDSKGYPRDWVFRVNDALEITEKKMESGRKYSDERIGEKDGVAVYKTDDLVQNNNAGNVTAFIDYGDYYLVVSENNTGVYEKTPPTISAAWYYTETVYSGYDWDGNLIFRTSVDSSTNYELITASLYMDSILYRIKSFLGI